MKLYEYMAKDIFRTNGIPVPKGQVFTSAEEVADFVAQIGPVAIKSQILSGGRGKAGGIKFATDPQEATEKARELLATDIKGLKVDIILVEQKLTLEKELYLAITYDGARRKPLLIASAAGRVEIEQVADELLVKRLIDINIGLHPYAAREITRQLGLTGQIAKEVAAIMLKLYQLFRKYDAELIEINPLVVADSQVIAADGKMTVDDEAAFRFGKDVPLVEEKTAVEKRAAELGISYVELDGEIGVMANRAGITMATLDLINEFGSSPRNFMDAGGGSSKEATASALEILLSTQPKAILINIFGGITRCDEVAKAFIQVKETMDIQVPVVIRLVGTNEEAGIALLAEHGIESYRNIDEAVANVVAFVKANTFGLISPGKSKIGIMPNSIFIPGSVGVVARSGTLSYEIVSQLTNAGIGQSTVVGLGGDRVVGLSFIDVLTQFEADPETKAVVLVGEIGGNAEEEASLYIKTMSKPVIAFLAGKSAPPGKRMGHAGAIIERGKGTYDSKVVALKAAGAYVASLPWEVSDLVKRALTEKREA